MFSFNPFKKHTADFTVNIDNLRLIKPDIRYIDSFRSAYKEYRRNKVEDFGYYRVSTMLGVRKFFKMAAELDSGLNLERYGAVRTTLYWLTDGVHYLGSGSLRHNLNDNLRKFGGNIGYCVRPSCWGIGLGTVQLTFLLKEAKKIGLKTARLTCFATNIASRRVMEKNGAVFVERVKNRLSGGLKETDIYEIDLTNF